MAEVVVLFDLDTGVKTGTVTTETWLTLIGPLSAGQKVWFGYADWYAEEKDLIFELRVNKTGQSAATDAATDIYDIAAAQSGSSVSRDWSHQGDIVKVMTTTPTGGEKVYVKVRGKGNVSTSFGLQMNYAWY